MFCCFKQCMATSPINKNSKISSNELNSIYFNVNKYNSIGLGSGAVSDVYKITVENIPYTCKKFISASSEMIISEIKILKEISGERLPSFFKNIITLEAEYILYKYIPGSDLFNFISKNAGYFVSRPIKIAEIIYEITLGLQELFKYNYIHLDLKPENIILSSLRPIKLTLVDLAFCRKLDLINNYGSSGTFGYSSPEVILYKRYYHNSDIWSLGVIAYLLFTERSLFPTNDRMGYENDLNKFNSIEDDPLLENISLDAFNLLNGMLQKTHLHRLSVNNVLENKFIKQINK